MPLVACHWPRAKQTRRPRRYAQATTRSKTTQHIIHDKQFPSYTMLKSMRKCKNRYFYHIFVSPGDAPGAIMLNVAWIEREFDAYKLPRGMCPSNYNRF